MREYQRPRHYLRPPMLIVLRPLFRYSQLRDAYVLRIGGDKIGPVLKRDRRERRRPSEAYSGRERRAAARA